LLPKAQRRCFGINVDQRPPCFLVDLAVQLAVVNATKRDSELIADLAAEGARLHETEMVGIAGLPATHQTRQGGDEVEVLLVADPPRPLGHLATTTSISARILCGASGRSGPICGSGSAGAEWCVVLETEQPSVGSVIGCDPLIIDAAEALRCAWL
jgi:hypothetical protein